MNYFIKIYFFNIPSGQTITKEVDLENYNTGNMKIEYKSSKKQSISMIGYTAVVSVTVMMKGKYLEHIIDGDYRVIRIWKVLDNSWKVIAGSSVQI